MARVFLARPFVPVVASAPSIGLAWLVRLRWAAAAGQLLLLTFAIAVLDYPVHRIVAGSLLAFAVFTNVLLQVRLSRHEPTSDVLLAIVLMTDTALLTGMLLASGGISNPFSVFYLVHVALAALLLSGRWTWAIASLSTACFAILFAAQDPHAMHHGHGDFSIHLRGMLLSYAIAAGSIGFFVSWLKRSLAQRESQLAELDAMRTRSEQVVGLSALAAGAAHELGSPLGTIALIAKEMEHALAREADSAQLTDQRVATLERLREDAALLRSEVDRCRAILATMGDRAGEPQVDDAEQVATSAITDAVREALGPRRAERLRIKGADATHVRASQRPLVQALVSLVANGLDASPDTEPVELEVVRDNGEVRFVVTDRGGGMPPETLARIGEPFFTTKPKSRGFGLGLFLVRSFAERSRARLEVSSTPGSGTQVTLSMASES